MSTHVPTFKQQSVAQNKVRQYKGKKITNVIIQGQFLEMYNREQCNRNFPFLLFIQESKKPALLYNERVSTN